MSLGQLVVLLVAAQRLAELLLARRNARRLLAAGAVEAGRGHYPLIVLLHSGWLVALWVGLEDVWPVSLPLLGLYLLLQPARIWVIATLGARWTTRIIVVPGAPLEAGGPYRFLRHPNYVIVVLEIALLPLALGNPWAALVFSLLNAALLAYRRRVEDQALGRGRPGPPR